MTVSFVNVSFPRSLGDSLRDEVIIAASRLGITLVEANADNQATMGKVLWIIARGEPENNLQVSIIDALKRFIAADKCNPRICISVDHQENTKVIKIDNVCTSPIWTVLADPRPSPTSAQANASNILWIGFKSSSNIEDSPPTWHGEHLAGMRLAKVISLMARGKPLPMSGPVGFPQKAMIEITRRCNLHCVLCPVGNGTATFFPDMETDIFCRIVNFIAPTVWKAKLYNYGEPLMHPQFSQFVKYAKMAGIEHVEVSSNGMLLNEHLSKEIILSGLDAIHISIDGPDQQNYGAYRKGGDVASICKNVKTLRSLRDSIGIDKPLIEVQCLATCHTENRINDMNAIANDVGADSFRLKTFNAYMSGKKFAELGRKFLPRNRGLSRYNDYLKLTYKGRYRLLSCQWPFDRLVVNSDGTAVPCCYDFNANHRLGSFRSHDKDWWWTAERQRFIEQLISAPLDIDMCARCPVGVPSLTANEDKATKGTSYEQ